VRALAHAYDTKLTHGQRLGDLEGGPRFVFCATDMIFGVDWIFDSADPGVAPPGPRIGDYQVGYRAAPGVLLSEAVAASSCFPPVFNPLEMHLDPSAFSGGRYDEDDRDRLVRGISLSDGGVYDNL